ncbi:phytanoyl-CoA dioxygenase family protein [Lederbergia lenta]|nr:phytanoyl-CoA dioxygenase family protein [Lederbergia lenta]MCM3111227.1 phytanoyl-CoA dioxygenase family protein [Lederbergia lenta]MEC2325385.1 phytanoyl-CoA dioxygenase family protein [Lederbergia lenta]
MLTSKQIKDFNENGFVKGDVILNDAEVERLREELDLVMDGKSVKKPVLTREMNDNNSEFAMKMAKKDTVVQIVNMWMASEAFLNHAANETLCEEVAQLSKTDTLRIWHDQVQYKPPVVGGPGDWHQDHPAWPIIQPADLISAWVALDDATIENGCMWMVPQSHLWGDQQKYLSNTPDFKPSHQQPDLLPQGANTQAIPFEIKKGQVGYHHCLTWHGSGPNRSQRKRRAIAVHYMPGHVRYEPTGSHPMEPFVTVKPGEILKGDDFPIVYKKKTVTSL